MPLLDEFYQPHSYDLSWNSGLLSKVAHKFGRCWLISAWSFR
jgi:hypothetical protein